MEVTVLVVILTTMLSVFAKNIDERCKSKLGLKIECSCVGNEEFILPEDYDYKYIDSISVTGCNSANIHFSSMTEARYLNELIIQNISGRLDFNAYITSKSMKLLKLCNIGWIPAIQSHTFSKFNTIETIEIRNTRIENFKEDFLRVNVPHFIMTNVIVENMTGLHLMEFGMNRTLRIKNSEIRNIVKSITFNNFQTIEIADSKFELQKPNMVSLQANSIVVTDSIFMSASMNFVAKHAVNINGNCADGQSTLRVSTKYIVSVNNRLPNEIAYPLNGKEDVHLLNQNNTVCKAGNCKCSTTAKAPCQMCAPLLLLRCLLSILLAMLLSKGFY